MAFKRPIAAVRSVIPQNFGAPKAKDFSADLYAYLSGSAHWATSLPTGNLEEAVLTLSANSDGSGYVVGEVLTVDGGTSIIEAATLTVTSVGGSGEVTGVALRSRGEYGTAPTGTQNVLGGVGSSATASVTSGTLPGSYSFLAEVAVTPPKLNQPFQINFRNFGSAGAPDDLLVHVGINPDGSSSSVVDSIDPSNAGSGPGSATNFSGDGTGDIGHGPTAMRNGISPGASSNRYLILDFDDALLVIFYDSTESFTPRAFHAGLIWSPRWDTDATGAGQIRMDGLGVLGYQPTSLPSLGSSAGNWWHYTTGSTFCAVRIATGNVLGTTTSSSWLRAIGTSITSVASDYPIGDNLAQKVYPILTWVTTHGSVLGEFKYLKAAMPSLPLKKNQYRGRDYLLYINDAAVDRSLSVHIPDGLDPFTDGVYNP